MMMVKADFTQHSMCTALLSVLTVTVHYSFQLFLSYFDGFFFPAAVRCFFASERMFGGFLLQHRDETHEISLKP